MTNNGLQIEISPLSTREVTHDELLLLIPFYEYDGKTGWRLPTAHEYISCRSLEHHIWDQDNSARYNQKTSYQTRHYQLVRDI